MRPSSMLLAGMKSEKMLYIGIHYIAADESLIYRASHRWYNKINIKSNVWWARESSFYSYIFDAITSKCPGAIVATSNCAQFIANCCTLAFWRIRWQWKWIQNTNICIENEEIFYCDSIYYLGNWYSRSSQRTSLICKRTHRSYSYWYWNSNFDAFVFFGWLYDWHTGRSYRQMMINMPNAYRSMIENHAVEPWFLLLLLFFCIWLVTR